MVSEDKKELKLVGQAAEFKFESDFEPLPIICTSLLKAGQTGKRKISRDQSLSHCLAQSFDHLLVSE